MDPAPRLSPTPRCRMLLAVAFASVTVSPAAGGIQAAEHYPLGPGMKWNYLRVDGEERRLEVSVLVDRALGDRKYHLQPSNGGEGALVQVEGERIYSVAMIAQEPFRTLILDFTLPAGSTWEIPCDGEIAVESTSETVAVPAGTFERCWRFRTEIRCLPGLGVTRTWYAPGVGRIKTENDRLAGKVAEELLSFEPLSPFLRGDANGDRALDLSDPISVLSWLFLGAPPPPCEESADLDGDGQASITDAILALSHLFLAGDPPPPPFPGCARPALYALPCASRGSCDG